MWAKLKNIHKSFTIWLNGIAISALPVLDYLKSSIPDLEQYLDANIYKNAMLALLALNIALRFKTSKPLEDK